MVDDARAALQHATQRLSTLYEEVESEIKEAEPALATASIALDGPLNKRDMNEVKSLTKAPASVEKAFAAVLTLLGEKDVSWAGTKKVTSHPNFILTYADEPLGTKGKKRITTPPDTTTKHTSRPTNRPEVHPPPSNQQGALAPLG